MRAGFVMTVGFPLTEINSSLPCAAEAGAARPGTRAHPKATAAATARRRRIGPPRWLGRQPPRHQRQAVVYVRSWACTASGSLRPSIGTGRGTGGPHTSAASAADAVEHRYGLDRCQATCDRLWGERREPSIGDTAAQRHGIGAEFVADETSEVAAVPCSDAGQRNGLAARSIAALFTVRNRHSPDCQP